MADPDSISIICPHCEDITTKPMSWAMTHFTSRCTKCRKSFLFDRGYLLRTIQRLVTMKARPGHARFRKSTFDARR